MGLFIIGRRDGITGAGGRARGPNLSRSIDAVIRALNFIRSAVRSARTKCCIFCHAAAAAAVARIMTPYDASDQTAEATHTRRNKKATSFCPRFTHEREFLRLRARPVRTTATAVFAHPPPARARRGAAALCGRNEFPFVCCIAR